MSLNCELSYDLTTYWEDGRCSEWDGVTAHGLDLIAQYVSTGRKGVTLNYPSDHPAEPLHIPADLTDEELLRWMLCYSYGIDAALEGGI